MKQTTTEVHAHLKELGLSVTQFLEDTHMSTAGFYRALKAHQGLIRNPTRTVRDNMSTIEAMLTLQTRRSYDTFIKTLDVLSDESKPGLTIIPPNQGTFDYEKGYAELSRLLIIANQRNTRMMTEIKHLRKLLTFYIGGNDEPTIDNDQD